MRTVSGRIQGWLVLPVVVVLAACTAGPGPTSTSESGAVPPSDAASTTEAAGQAARWPEPSAGPLPADVVDALQAALDSWPSAKNGPGVTAAVISAGGSWTGAAGIDGSGQPLVPDAMMGIGSITKTFTAAEIMLLVDDGVIDLTAPLEQYVSLPFSGGGATIEQALGMMSGFPDVAGEVLGTAATAEPDTAWTAAEVIATIEPDALRQGSMGVVPAYSNTNFVLLGMVIEKVTGQSFAEAVRSDLLAPMSLDRVVVQDAEQPVAPVAVPVPDLHNEPVVGNGRYLPSHALASMLGAAGGMAADAISTARWIHLLYGGHVLDQSLVDQMTDGDNPYDWYGLGTYRIDVNGQLLFGHSGSIPGYTSMAYLFPDGTTVAVLVPQSEQPSVPPDVSLDQLLSLLHTAVDPAAPGTSATS